MKKFTVKNSRWQTRLDTITGWREVALVAATIVLTAAVVWLAFRFEVL